MFHCCNGLVSDLLMTVHTRCCCVSLLFVCVAVSLFVCVAVFDCLFVCVAVFDCLFVCVAVFHCLFICVAVFHCLLFVVAIFDCLFNCFIPQCWPAILWGEICVAALGR